MSKRLDDFCASLSEVYRLATFILGGVSCGRDDPNGREELLPELDGHIKQLRKAISTGVDEVIRPTFGTRPNQWTMELLQDVSSLRDDVEILAKNAERKPERSWKGNSADWHRNMMADCLQRLTRLRERLDSATNLELFQPIAPAVGEEVPSGPKEKGPTWQKVLPRAESYVQRNGFSGLRALARALDCHHTVLRKAIDNSEKLRAAEKRHLDQKEATIPKRRRQRLNEVLGDSLGANVDVPEAVSVNVDDAFQRLLEAAMPAERAKLHQKTLAERRLLVAALEDDPDVEFRFAKSKTANGREHVTGRKAR